MENNIAPHEAIEVRELINMEALGIKKITANIQRVKDSELKNFMQDSINSKKTALKEIQASLAQM